MRRNLNAVDAIENKCYIQIRGSKMTAKIKPVEPTVIKNKKIVRDVIAQVRRKPTSADLKRAGVRSDLFRELTAQ